MRRSSSASTPAPEGSATCGSTGSTSPSSPRRPRRARARAAALDLAASSRDHPRMASDFLTRDVPALKKNVFRLGLSGSFGLDEAGSREALERMQYVFWFPQMKGLTPALRDALRRDRERYVVATGPILGYFPGAVRKAAESRLRALGTDYLDVLQLSWLSKMSAFTGAVQEELLRLREEGKVRALGASIH